MTNPLLDFSGLPRFADIRTEHITPAVEQLLADNRVIIAGIRGDAATPTWQNFVQPMVDANEHLSRAWGQVSHLNAVVNSPGLRKSLQRQSATRNSVFCRIGSGSGAIREIQTVSK